MEREEARQRIRARIAELAAELGRRANHLGDDDIIPQSGVLDSAGILGLIVWSETEFGVPIELDEISIDNFGSINRMLDFIESRAR